MKAGATALGGNIMQAATTVTSLKAAPNGRNILIFVLLAATAILVRIPKLLRPKSYLIAAATMITGGAAIGWLAPGPNDARSSLRRLAAAAAGAAITLPLLLTAPQRAMLLATPVALIVIISAIAVHLGWGVTRVFRAKDLGLFGLQHRMETILSEFFPPIVGKFAAAEIMVIRYVFAFRTPPTFPSGARAFTCHKSGVLALIWTVVALSFVEVCLVHLVVRQWSQTTAILVSLISELSVVYLIGVANSLRCLPTFLNSEGVQVRMGILIDQHFSWAEVARVETISGASRKSSVVLRAAAISSPNVRLTLNASKPVTRLFRRTQTVGSVELYLDDAAGFVSSAKQFAQANYLTA